MEQIAGSPSSTGITIQDALAIVWRRKWIALAVFLVTVGLGYRFVTTRKPVWTATAQMIVTERGTTLTNSSDTDAAPNTTAIETPQTQITMMQTDKMAELTWNRLKEDVYHAGQPESVIGAADAQDFHVQFLGAIKVINPTDTSLLDVSVTTDDRIRSKMWADATCEAFVEWKKQMARQTTRDIINNLQVSLDKTLDKLHVAESKEKDFKDQTQVVDVTSELKSTEDQYEAHKTAAEAAQQELAAQQEHLRKVTAQLAQLNSALNTSPTVRSDMETQALQARIHDLEYQLDALHKKYTPAMTSVFKPIESQLTDLHAELARQLKATSRGAIPSLATQAQLTEDRDTTQRSVSELQSRLGEIISQRDATKARLEQFPKTQLDYERLAHRTALLQELTSRYQFQLTKAQSELQAAHGNVEITQTAYPPLFPSGLAPGRVMLVSILFGLMLAVGSALLLERGDHRIRNADRVRALIGGPVIGTLPRLSYLQMRRLTQGDTPPIAAESYSLACANLMLALRHAWQDEIWHQQLVLVTSAVPNEGKSITASEVAKFMARSGKKVILVDADMRRPTQRRLFNMDSPIGLADALTGDKEIEELLMDTDEPNLQLMPAGVVKRNPTQLMSSPSLPRTLENLRKAADVVIIDAPACAIVADAMLIAPHVDCILQVIGAGVVQEHLVRETTEALRAAAPRTMAFIVNRSPNDRSRVYSPYYFKEYRNGAGRDRNADEEDTTYALPGGDEPDPDAPEPRDRPKAG